MEQYRTCPSCKETKELTPDYWYVQKSRRGGGWSGYCKECMRGAVANKAPLIVVLSKSPSTSLLSTVSGQTRLKIKRAKGQVWVHSLDTDTFRKYTDGQLSNEDKTYSEMLEDLHTAGYTIRQSKFI